MTYSWRNQALIDLPMRMAQHDPVNLRTLNLGTLGANGHATFGDGSTPATYPTKLDYQRGYNLDGGDYFNIPHVADLTVTSGSLSMSFWVRMDSIAAFSTFISKGALFGTQNYYLRNDDGQIEFIFRDSTDTLHAQYQTTGTPVPVGALTHIGFALTFGTAASAAIYINGQDQPGTWALGTGAELPITNTDPVRLGIRGGTQPLYGTMEDFKMAKAYWTPTQFADIYINGLRKAGKV